MTNRTIYASKSYKRGDVIVSCQPISHFLYENERRRRCTSCLIESSSLKMCKPCGVVFYCNVDCQRKDWNDHHKHGECKALKRAKELGRFPNLSDYKLLVILRLYLTLKSKPDLKDTKYELPDGQKVSYMDLITHEENVKKNPDKYRKYKENIFLMGLTIENCDEELLMDCIMKMNVNCFSVWDVYDGIATALYIPASIFNHSCRPNTSTVFNGTLLQIRALRDIESGEEILISYYPAVESRKNRKEKLQNTFYFDCQCPRCSSEDDDALLFQEVERITRKLKEVLDRDVEEIEAGRKYYEAHHLYLEKIKLYQKELGEYHPSITIGLMRAATALCDSHHPNHEALLSLMQKLNRALLVTHGTDHNLYKEYNNLLVQVDVNRQMLESFLATLVSNPFMLN